MARPAESEYAPYYQTYISLVPETDIMAVLSAQLSELEDILGAVPPEREVYRYEPDKWSVREVLGHLIDGERVFSFRGFCFSRGDRAAMPSFDQNDYVVESRYHGRKLKDLISEFTELRRSNIRLFGGLDDDRWTRSGTASGSQVSVRALAYIMAGHLRHHFAILRDRYGLGPGGKK